MIKENLDYIKSSLKPEVTLVAVSKTKPIHMLEEAYEAGQRVFGENRVQELCEKEAVLPKDIEWHMIGHLQSKKVKQIASFVSLIHGVDSIKLLIEINKQGIKNNRRIPVLLQFHIAEETSKFGFVIDEDWEELKRIKVDELEGVELKGVMGMATFTSDQRQVREEFNVLKQIHTKLQAEMFDNSFDVISMGMSGDYEAAISAGSTMIRVGSSIFGARN
jgi:PLP dependent protein